MVDWENSGGDTSPHEGEEEEGEEGTATQIVVASLWHWWKEVVFISFVTAIMMNILITRPVIENIRQNFRHKLNLLANKKVHLHFRLFDLPRKDVIKMIM